METYVLLTKESWNICLSRKVTEKQLDGTFQEMLEFMIEPTALGGNDEYKGEELRLSESLGENYRNEKSGLTLGYFDTFDNLHPANLQDIVSSKSDIYHSDVIMREGQTSPFQKVMLTCDTAYDGGLPQSLRVYGQNK